MKVGSTDEFWLLLHFVPVLFTTITFFPWHYKTICQISRSRVSITVLKWIWWCWSQGWSGVWSHERPWSTKSRPSPSLLSTISPSTSQQISVRTSGWRASVRRPTGWARSTPCTRWERCPRTTLWLTSRRCSYSETLTNEEIVQDLQFNEIIKSIEQATQNIKMFLQLVMENLYFVNQNLTYL